MDYTRIKVLWKGVPQTWHHCEYDTKQHTGYAIICINGEHFQVHELLEIHLDGKLVYCSPDIWYAGMLRPY